MLQLILRFILMFFSYPLFSMPFQETSWRWHIDSSGEFRLASVEAYPEMNIRYEVYHNQEMSLYRGYLIVFGKLTEKQFQFLHQTYGGKSHVSWDKNREYELLDFLSPQIQALMNHYFLAENFSSFKETIVTNCWGTAYEIARGAQADFSLFYVDSLKINELLSSDQYSEKVSEPKSGDVLLLRTSSKARNVLHHAAIYIDQNLYFEMPGSADYHPYRLVFGKNFQHPDYKSMAQEYRRFDLKNFSPLPPPQKVFTSQHEPVPLRAIAFEFIPAGPLKGRAVIPEKEFYDDGLADGGIAFTISKDKNPSACNNLWMNSHLFYPKQTN